MRIQPKQYFQETKMMNLYKRNYSSLGFVAGDVEVDWGRFEPPSISISDFLGFVCSFILIPMLLLLCSSYELLNFDK